MLAGRFGFISPASNGGQGMSVVREEPTGERYGTDMEPHKLARQADPAGPLLSGYGGAEDRRSASGQLSAARFCR
ncbi:hypothetical protein RHIZ404_220063 [Rhizobium sp. EC-SD404]|nr:hypothetical protein RHIZ404_220063 [Rhizobium sp. EC-SD404]